MTRSLRIALVATTWGIAVAADVVGETAAGIAAFFAVAILPGALLDAYGDRGGSPSAAERPARALTLSVGMTTILGAAAAALGASIVAVAVGLACVSFLLSLTPREHIDPAGADSVDRDRMIRLALCCLGLVTIAAVAIAAARAGVARDRMWYLAYVTKLAGPGAIDWSEPFLGSGEVLPRFAYNGWLLTLATWTYVCGVTGQALFERLAPPLLVAATASAAIVLGRTLFADRRAAAVAALAAVCVLIRTRYPYFSPEQYPFFTRLAEDKTVALLVFFPVALSLAVAMARETSMRDLRRAVSLVLALVATALTHALVYALLLIGLAAYAVTEFVKRDPGPRTGRPILAAALVAVIAIAPGWLGLAARSSIVESPSPYALMESEPKHPVVRSHLRMDRLRPIPYGGPIVDPELLIDPVLVLCLIGSFCVLRRRGGQDSSLLFALTFPFLALAFVPWIAPAFGRAVVPWMAYRALWAVPFGALFAALVARFNATENGRAFSLICVLLAAASLSSLPWERLRESGSESVSTEAREILSTLSRLAPTTKVAAAPGFSELIPALAGRYILAFSDRGTTVFARSRRDAERRMQAATALVGLVPGSSHLRDRLVGYYGITHTVYDSRRCPRGSVSLVENAQFSLCAERSKTSARPAMRRLTAVASPTAEGFELAALGDGIICRPPPLADGPAKSPANFRWHRAARWSPRAVEVNCETRFPRGVRASRLRLELNLPKSEEALVYRIAINASDGRRLRRRGVLEFRGNPNGEIMLPPVEMTKIRLRILPAYLPYLNLRGLTLLR